MGTIFLVNAGSSSVKFQVFAIDAEARLKARIRGQIDRIVTAPGGKRPLPAGSD